MPRQTKILKILGIHFLKHLEQFEINSTNAFVQKYGRLPDNDENDMVVPLPIVDGSPNRINQTKILNEKKDDTFLFRI